MADKKRSTYYSLLGYAMEQLNHEQLEQLFAFAESLSEKYNEKASHAGQEVADE
jgi:GTP-sensing pleiotropic transcriptional regulator CodY